MCAMGLRTQPELSSLLPYRSQGFNSGCQAAEYALALCKTHQTSLLAHIHTCSSNIQINNESISSTQVLLHEHMDSLVPEVLMRVFQENCLGTILLFRWSFLVVD